MIFAPTVRAGLAKVKPVSFRGDLARRVGLEGLLSPVANGHGLDKVNFLYAGTRRNRFTAAGGPASLYLGADEEIGAAETKQTAFLGSFSKVKAHPAVVFWLKVNLPDAVLDLTDPAVLRTLGVTDAEVYDPNWKAQLPVSGPEVLGSEAFDSGRFAAIKYWSVRMRQNGQEGLCFCVFQERVRDPCFVEIELTAFGLKQRWP